MQAVEEEDLGDEVVHRCRRVFAAEAAWSKGFGAGE